MRAYLALAMLFALCTQSGAFVVHALSAPAVRRNAVSRAVEHFQKMSICNVHVSHMEDADVIKRRGSLGLPAQGGEEQLAKAIQDLTSTKTSSADAAFSSAAWPLGSYATYAFA